MQVNHYPTHIFYYSPEFGTEDELQSIFSWETSVEQYSSLGGTARAAVAHQVDTLRSWLGVKATCSN